MSYLLEALGRGLLGHLWDAFEAQLPGASPEEAELLAARQRAAPTSFDLAMRAGSAHLHAARLSAARGMFETAARLDGPRHLPALGLACVYDELGQLRKALECLDQAQQYDPDDPAIAFAIGWCRERQGLAGAAAEAYWRAAELCPQLRNAHERLAALALRQRDWPAAHDRYAHLVRLEPGELACLLMLGGIELCQNEPQQAIETFQRALLLEPESADDVLEAAEELENDGQLRQAIDTLEKLVAKYPGVTEFRVHLGDLYVKAGDDEGAVAQYQAALELHPTFLEATVKLGTQHLRRQRYEEAAQEFNRAVELNDRLLLAFVGLGLAQHLAACEQDARATFDLAASLVPNSTLLFFETNRLYLKADRQTHAPVAFAELEQDDLLEEAVCRHRQILLAQPRRADVHYRLGMLLRQFGDFSGAVEAFRQAVALAPTHAQALIKLGITLWENGQTQEALSAFCRALTLDEQQAELHYQLGLLFAQRNRFDLTVEHVEATFDSEAAWAEFHHNLALALASIGMVDRADAAWRSTCELSACGGSTLRQSRFQPKGDG